MTTSGRSPVEGLAETPGNRSAPSRSDLAAEVAVLAELLADVVELVGTPAIFPGRWAEIAGLALDTRACARRWRRRETCRDGG